MDDVLDAFDRRLDPLVPTGPAPVTDLVRRGRARRTRRRGLQAGLAAAVAVVAVATTSAVVQGRDASSPPASPAGSAPADPKVRTVGLDGLAVDVPADWVARPDCGSGPNTVSFAPELVACDEERLTIRSAVHFADAYRAEPLPVVNGLEVERLEIECGPTDLCTPDLVAHQSLNFPGTKHAVRVYGSDRTEIADSARPVPSGLAAVPVVAGLDWGEAQDRLRDAGLEPPDVEPLLVVSDSVPEAGSVVPLGTRVALERRRDDDAPDGFRQVEFQGVAVSIPQGWVPCAMVQPGGAGPGFGPPGTDGQCAVGRDGQVRDMVSLDTFAEPDLDDAPTTVQDGLALRVLTGCGPPAKCVDSTAVRVRAVESGVNVRIRSSSPDLAERIRDSIRAAG